MQLIRGCNWKEAWLLEVYTVEIWMDFEGLLDSNLAIHTKVFLCKYFYSTTIAGFLADIWNVRIFRAFPYAHQFKANDHQWSHGTIMITNDLMEQCAWPLERSAQKCTFPSLYITGTLSLQANPNTGLFKATAISCRNKHTYQKQYKGLFLKIKLPPPQKKFIKQQRAESLLQWEIYSSLSTHCPWSVRCI